MHVWVGEGGERLWNNLFSTLSQKSSTSGPGTIVQKFEYRIVSTELALHIAKPVLVLSILYGHQSLSGVISECWVRNKPWVLMLWLINQIKKKNKEKKVLYVYLWHPWLFILWFQSVLVEQFDSESKQSLSTNPNCQSPNPNHAESWTHRENKVKTDTFPLNHTFSDLRPEVPLEVFYTISLI